MKKAFCLHFMNYSIQCAGERYLIKTIMKPTMPTMKINLWRFTILMWNEENKLRMSDNEWSWFDINEDTLEIMFKSWLDNVLANA